MTREEADRAADGLNELVTKLCDHAGVDACIFQFAIPHEGAVLIAGTCKGSIQHIAMTLVNSNNDWLQDALRMIKEDTNNLLMQEEIKREETT